MSQITLTGRRGARRRAEIPREVLRILERGEAETVNLMEWLATDMQFLCRHVAKGIVSTKLRAALVDAADMMSGSGITKRLKIAGNQIANAVEHFEDASFVELATHRSDLVRQWACYAVNSPDIAMELDRRLDLTCQFAVDANMSVRETAWMAFRPHLALDLQHGVRLLKNLVVSRNENVRRFSIEVSRPRSVWGSHIEELKRRPHICGSILERVRRDDSRYVRLAAGNWLNDASKSQPLWVSNICRRWMRRPDPRTVFIVTRGLRSIDKSREVLAMPMPRTGARLRISHEAGKQAC